MPARLESLRTIVRLFGYARAYWRYILLTAGVTAAYAGASRGVVYFLKPLLDTVLPAQDWGTLRLMIGVGVAGSFLVAGLSYAKDYLKRWLMLKILIDIRVEVCRHLLSQSLRFFTQRQAGDLLSRVTNDIAVTQVALEHLFDDALLHPFMILAAFGAACAANWQLSLIALPGILFFVLPLLRMGRGVRKTKKRSLSKLADIAEDIHQMFTGVRIVKSFHMEAAEIADFRRKNESYLEKTIKVVKLKAGSDAVVELLSALALLGIVFLGAWLIVTRRFGMTVGSLSTFAGAMILLRDPLKGLTKTMNTLQEALAGCDRVFELLDMPPEITDEPGAVELTGIRTGIELAGVTFAYGDTPVLRDLDFTAPAGKVVALVGPSGAGKSTLLDLLARFYDPTRGAIKIDGTDLRRIQRSSLLGLLAVVTQETFLFNTSIAENIRYGRPEATEAEIEAAARAANIHDFILTLELGYRTTVGERGARLSGGQRQRIAIARALLKDPALLLLDEATSALDSESEQLVQGALNNLMRGRTTFVIAHRLSTIQHADVILAIEDGVLVESGTHAELLARDGLYRRLHRLQFAAAATPACDPSPPLAAPPSA
ncbi:MAG: ABC transporter ATP-binding protein [Planctomycetes bacterium]|nr:ABC transporter ATP-binding protein [Planctomycetota bacterium]